MSYCWICTARHACIKPVQRRGVVTWRHQADMRSPQQRVSDLLLSTSPSNWSVIPINVQHKQRFIAQGMSWIVSKWSSSGRRFIPVNRFGHKGRRDSHLWPVATSVLWITPERVPIAYHNQCRVWIDGKTHWPSPSASRWAALPGLSWSCLHFSSFGTPTSA